MPIFSWCVLANDTPIINVTGALPGASPEVMASSFVLPLEKQFSTISGLATIRSTIPRLRYNSSKTAALMPPRFTYKRPC